MGGFIIGRLNHPADMVKTGMMAGLVKVAQKLPEQDRTLLRTALHDAKPRFKEAMQHRREAQNEIKKALRAEPFDVQKLAAAMDKARQITDQGRDNFHDMVLDLAPKFSPEGRKALANIRRDRDGDQHRMMDMIESKIDTPPSP